MFDTNMMLQGFLGMITPFSMLLMILGVAIGSIFGAIPGLTGGIAIAILLPLTFRLCWWRIWRKYSCNLIWHSRRS